jgi:hypothetical protein
MPNLPYRVLLVIFLIIYIIPSVFKIYDEKTQWIIWPFMIGMLFGTGLDEFLKKITPQIARMIERIKLNVSSKD